MSDFESWWKTGGIEMATYAEKMAAQKGFAAGQESLRQKLAEAQNELGVIKPYAEECSKWIGTFDELREKLVTAEHQRDELLTLLSSFRGDVLLRIGTGSPYRKDVVAPFYERVKIAISSIAIKPGVRFRQDDGYMEVVRPNEKIPGDWWCKSTEAETGLWSYSPRTIIENMEKK